ncbi:hypothetical protein ACFSKT_00015 [Paenibacillus xanthanilyticus]|uniref:hypothetical protein n=1 Tax=Paenibacillus xanthanilyticus TaxID=1783531 RepID=UPI00362D53DB
MAETGTRLLGQRRVDLSYEPRLKERGGYLLPYRRAAGPLEGRGVLASRSRWAAQSVRLLAGLLEKAARFSEDRGLIHHIHVAETSDQIQRTRLSRFGLRNLELVEAVASWFLATQWCTGIW